MILRDSLRMFLVRELTQSCHATSAVSVPFIEQQKMINCSVLSNTYVFSSTPTFVGAAGWGYSLFRLPEAHFVVLSRDGVPVDGCDRLLRSMVRMRIG